MRRLAATVGAHKLEYATRFFEILDVLVDVDDRQLPLLFGRDSTEGVLAEI